MKFTMFVLFVAAVALGQSPGVGTAEQSGSQVIIPWERKAVYIEVSVDPEARGILTISTDAPYDALDIQLINYRGQVISPDLADKYTYLFGAKMLGGIHFLKVSFNSSYQWSQPVTVGWEIDEPNSSLTAGLIRFNETVLASQGIQVTAFMEGSYFMEVKSLMCSGGKDHTFWSSSVHINQWDANFRCYPPSNFLGIVKVEGLIAGGNSVGVQFRNVKTEVEVVASRPVIRLTGFVNVVSLKDKNGVFQPAWLNIPIQISRMTDGRTGETRGYSTIVLTVRGQGVMDDLKLSIPIRFLGVHSEPLIVPIESIGPYMDKWQLWNRGLELVSFSWQDDGVSFEKSYLHMGIVVMISKNSPGVGTITYGRLAEKEVLGLPEEIRRYANILPVVKE